MVLKYVPCTGSCTLHAACWTEALAEIYINFRNTVLIATVHHHPIDASLATNDSIHIHEQCEIYVHYLCVESFELFGIWSPRKAVVHKFIQFRLWPPYTRRTNDTFISVCKEKNWLQSPNYFIIYYFCLLRFVPINQVSINNKAFNQMPCSTTLRNFCWEPMSLTAAIATIQEYIQFHNIHSSPYSFKLYNFIWCIFNLKAILNETINGFVCCTGNHNSKRYQSECKT